nr:MAG TPA: hypothetical protein [Caudoviricetes sp.]
MLRSSRGGTEGVSPPQREVRRVYPPSVLI